MLHKNALMRPFVIVLARLISTKALYTRLFMDVIHNKMANIEWH